MYGHLNVLMGTLVRAEPVDSALWWIVLLRSYTEGTGDHTLKEHLEMQKALKLILHCYLTGLLEQELDAKELLEQIDKCLIDLRFHIQKY
ncbi:unnamed protein product [Prunus brigantina]